jgi:myo-inositol-1(or 4)-monophosphatase
MAEDQSRLLDFACRLADAARVETLGRFHQGCAAENKAESGAYDPVTEADREAERVMRALIEQHYPEHGIAGEEFGEKAGQGPWCWSLDPIDGTRAFVFGLPSWVTLIALLEQGRQVIGVIDVSRLDERYVGGPAGARLLRDSGEAPLRVSNCTSLAEARLTTTDPALFGADEVDGFGRVRDRVRLIRYGLDAYGYARLAAGTIDLVIESGLKPHDYNALVPVVRGAGGIIADWNGGDEFAGGRVIAASTQTLFDEAAALLA